MSTTATLRIERNVPFPPTRQTAYDLIPWDKMKVGDAFVVSPRVFGESATERVRTAISIRQKTTSERFSVRRDGSVYRCWRIV